MHNDKYVKTKIKICNTRKSTIFHDNKVPEDNGFNNVENYAIGNVDENYYSQIFLV